MSKKSVVITGVSSGIGYDAAKTLVSKGYHVFGSVRKASDGEVLVNNFGDSFTPLLFDVTDAEAIAKSVSVVEKKLNGQGLTALVNNAGVCTPAPLSHVPLDEVRWAMEVNVFGLLAVTQAFLPLLGAQKISPFAPGRIVNITSINGSVAIPLFGAYNATKFAAEALNDTLRRELSLFGIKVSAIEPGEVKTDIQGKLDNGDLDDRYANTIYWPALKAIRDRACSPEESKKHGVPASYVSEKIVNAIESPNPRKRYPMHVVWRLNKLLPMGLIDKFLNKLSGIHKL